jgi:hypothetical protein
MGNPQNPESIARSAARPALVALLLAAVVAGCASPRVAPSQPLEALLRTAAIETPDGALVVQLAFGAGADLDLYVTDPLQETVYFANTPSRSGGFLDRDRTCSDAAPRVETIVFERPPPGRYRIGVEHPQSCGTGTDAPFAVRARRGEQGFERSGALPPRRFEAIVLELEID